MCFLPNNFIILDTFMYLTKIMSAVMYGCVKKRLKIPKG